MRTRLKGINSITKQLADGSWVTYRYAWKGGPPLHGDPGTPEFIASYNEAVAIKRPVVGKTLSSLTRYFQTTSEFKNDIKPRTRGDYVKQIKIIDTKFGDFPVSGLSDPRARGIFKEWRDELAEKSSAKPIMRGPFWRASSRWRKIAAISRSIPVSAADGSIRAR
jgi:hypothetical protein